MAKCYVNKREKWKCLVLNSWSKQINQNNDHRAQFYCISFDHFVKLFGALILPNDLRSMVRKAKPMSGIRLSLQIGKKYIVKWSSLMYVYSICILYTYLIFWMYILLLANFCFIPTLLISWCRLWNNGCPCLGFWHWRFSVNIWLRFCSLVYWNW